MKTNAITCECAIRQWNLALEHMWHHQVKYQWRASCHTDSAKQLSDLQHTTACNITTLLQATQHTMLSVRFLKEIVSETVRWLKLLRRHHEATKTSLQNQSKLDSLHWFSQRRSPTPHFGGCTQGGYDPKFKLGRDFCTVHLPPSFNILCLLVQKLLCWQTNKPTNK